MKTALIPHNKPWQGRALYLVVRTGLIVVAVISFLATQFFAEKAYAVVPKMLNYQGRMTNSSDVLIDGTTYYYQFEIYNDPTAGSLLWASYEDFHSTCGVAIAPSKGVFNTILGDDTVNNMSDIPINFDTNPYYLQIKISATQSNNVACEGALGAGASYETLSPRQRIVSSGYAFTARELSGDYDEKITNPSDDILAFTGVGGGDNTDLYLNLDGTYPILYSNTDTKVGIDDDLEFVGAQSVTTSTGALTIQPAAGNNLNISLSTTGDLAVNTNQLYVDTSAASVGIGTTGPAGYLDVAPTVTAVAGATKYASRIGPTLSGAINSAQTALYGEYNVPTINLSGGTSNTLTTLYGDYIGLTASAGIVTNWYGEYIAAPTGGGTVSNKYALVTAASTGNVGFGDTTPDYPLEILSTTTPQLAISYTDGSAYATFGVSSSGALTITPTSGQNLNIALATTGDFAVNTSQLYVDTSESNVGINDSTPSYDLDVTGTGRFTSTLYADAGINTTAGNLTLNSTGGTTTVDDNLSVTGNTTSTAGYADFGSYLRASDIRSEGDIYVNYDGADGDSNLYFYEGGSATGEYLRWDDVTGYGDGAGFYLSDDLELAGNIRKNVAASDLVINSTGASAGIKLQTGGSDKVTISSDGDTTLNSSTYGYLTFGELASAPAGAAARQYYNTTNDMMYYNDGNTSTWRSMQGVSGAFVAPEYPNAVSACVTGNCNGNLTTGYELVSNVLYTFYKWERTGGSGAQNIDLIIHLKMPDNFVSWPSGGSAGITFNYKTESSTQANNSVDWYVYEDSNAAALCSSTNLYSSVGGTWYTSSFNTSGCANLSNLTLGDTFYLRIRLNDAINSSVDAAYAGKITLYYQ